MQQHGFAKADPGQVIELAAAVQDTLRGKNTREAMMLSEKFFLVLEALRRNGRSDGSVRVVSSSPHVPIKLPEKTERG